MFEVGAIRARLGADVEELGFKRYDKLHQSAQKTAHKPVVATLQGALDEGDFNKYERKVADARREASRPIEATLSGDLDNVVFGKYDKAVSGARRTASKGVEVSLGAELDEGGFQDWESDLRKVRVEAKAPVEAELGARVDRRGFRAYQRHVREAEQLGHERDALRAKLGADVDEAGFRAYRRAARGAENDTSRLGRSVSDMGRKLGNALPNVEFTTRIPIYMVSAFALALAAAIPPAIALAGALGPILGQLAAIPGLATIAGGALVTAMLGLKGVIGAVGEAWDMEQSAAKDGVDQARAAEAAAESVRSAQEAAADTERDVTRARRDLTDATEEARHEQSKLRLEAIGAALAESESAAALRRARLELVAIDADTRSTGLDKREARLAVERARLGVREARGERAALDREVQEANQQGVRGSDRVTAARERLTDAERAAERATRQVAIATRDASRTMSEASGGAEKFQEEMAKLSPAGQAFVLLLQRKMFPMVRELRAEAQAGLLPGLGDGLVAAGRNFPLIEDMVRSYSDALGDAAREQGELLGSREQGKDMAQVFGFGETLIRRSSHATVDWTRGLTDLMVAAEPLYDWLGRINMRLADSFANWAEGGRESGKLERFFRTSVRNTELFVGTLWDTGRALVNIGGIGRRVWGQDMLGGIRGAAKEFRKWTESIEGERSIERYFVRWRKRWREIANVIQDVIDQYKDLKRDGKSTVEALATIITERLGEAFGELVAVAASQAPRIARGFVNGFLGANIWGKLLIGAWFISKLGGGRAIAAVGNRIGGQIADNFADNFMTRVDKRKGAMRRSGRESGRAMGRGVMAGLAVAVALFLPDIVKLIREKLTEAFPDVEQYSGKKGWGELLKDLGNLPGQATGLMGPGGREGGLVTSTGIQRFAEGGPVLPPGEDTWAALRYGEFVMKRDAVQRVGLSKLRQMNEGQDQQGAGADAVTGQLMGIAAAGAAAGQSAADALASALAGGKGRAVRASTELRDGVGGELGGLADDAKDSAKKLREGLVDNVGEAGELADREVRNMRRGVTRQVDGLADDAGSRTRRMAQVFDKQYGDMRDSAGRSMRGILGVTGRRLQETEGATRKGSRGIRNVLAGSYESMNRAVSTGLGYVQRATSKALEGLGGEPVRLQVPRPGKLATGGYVGMPGERGMDDQLYLLGRGEAVLNYHQQSRADDLLGYFGTSLNDIIGSDQRLHYAAGGKRSERKAARADQARFDAMIREAQRMDAQDEPYVLGGSHTTPAADGPWDCSSAVSRVVQAAYNVPTTSTEGPMESVWSNVLGRGAGKVTVFVRHGGAAGGHTFMRLGNRYFGTSGQNPGGGAGFFNDPGEAYRSGFLQFHLRDLGGAVMSALGGDVEIPKVKVRGPKGALKGVAERSIDKVRKAAGRYARRKAGALNDPRGDIGESLVSKYKGPLNRVFPQHSREQSPSFASLSSSQVRRSARAGGIRPPDDTYMEQISRGESTNYPGVVSWDGGYGLTQITPSSWGSASPLHGILSRLGGIGQMLNPIKNMTMARVMMGYAQREAGNRFQPWHGTKYLTAARGRVRRAASGKKGPSVRKQISRANAGVGKVIKKAGGQGSEEFSLGRFETKIEGLGDEYQRSERRFNISEEDLVLDPGDRNYDESYAISIGRFETDEDGKRVGLNYIDDKAIDKRAEELAALIKIQRRIVMTYTKYMTAVEKIVATYKASRARIAKVLAKAKPSRRKKYQDDMETMLQKQRGWEGALGDLGNRKFDAETDLMADRAEKDELRPGAEDSLDAPTVVEPNTGPDADAQLAQLQEQLKAAQETARLSDAAVRTLTGPGDIGAGGPTAQAAAANPQGVPGYTGPGSSGYQATPNGITLNGQSANPFAGESGAVQFIQKNYMMSPSDPKVLDQLGRTTVAGIGLQGVGTASREKVAV